MFEKIPIDTYINIIRKNHQAYLDANAFTQLDFKGAAAKKPIVDRYLQYMRHYRQARQSYFDDAVADVSLATNAAGGVTAILGGLGIGSLLFATQQNKPSLDIFGTKTITEGGFAAIIGACCSTLIFAAWSASNQKPMHDTAESCITEMAAAGFSANKYVETAKKLVKLFHFRECLLLGLKDNEAVNFRSDFITRYFPKESEDKFNGVDFNLSIEIYFLTELNALFHEAFQDIYQLHQQEIQQDRQQPEFIRWLTSHFADKNNQRRFTQEMQSNFLGQCIHFLAQEMSEPGWLAQYFYLTDSLAGLLAAAIITSIFATAIPFIPLTGLIAIAVVSFALGVAASHVAIFCQEILYYKRSQANRTSLHTIIEVISSEQKRLGQLIHKIVATTEKDLKDLHKFEQLSQSTVVQSLCSPSQTGHILVGSMHAWIREFANRYNDSETIEIDLLNTLHPILTSAQQQTTALQGLLQQALLQQNPAVNELLQLQGYVEQTRQFLLDSQQQQFRQTYQMTQKIKEQLLEVLSFTSIGKSKHGIPGFLLNFYTDPPEKGGLNGLQHDIALAISLAPVVQEVIDADANHPYAVGLLTVAFELNTRLSTQPNTAMLLHGDNQYRALLGLPTVGYASAEHLLTIHNIDDYLNASFDFLYALNHYDSNSDWQLPLQNHEEFIMYRLLLCRQLADLLDPNNLHVDSLLKARIKNFFVEKLCVDPDTAIDDIIHQSWMMGVYQDHRTLQDLWGNHRSIGALSAIAHAIRVDLSYISTPVTPKQLIMLEAKQFLDTHAHPYVFGYESSIDLIPEYSPEFASALTQTIQTTEAFLQFLHTRQLLTDTGVIHLYTAEIKRDIEKISAQIQQLQQHAGLAETSSPQHSMTSLLQQLSAFNQSLPQLSSVAMTHSDIKPLTIWPVDVASLKAPKNSYTTQIARLFNSSWTAAPQTETPMTSDAVQQAIAALTTYIQNYAEKPQSRFRWHPIPFDKDINVIYACKLKGMLLEFQQDAGITEDNAELWNRSIEPDLQTICDHYFPNGVAAFARSHRIHSRELS